MAFLDETGLAHFWQQILGRLNNFVRAEEGKGLSTNDLTDTLKSNYDAAYTHSTSTHAPTDAEKNAIIGIQKNGTDLSVNSSTRKVNITVPTSASDVGAVPTSRTINGKALNTNITLSASDIHALPDTTVIPSIDGLATKTYVDTKQAKITASGILKGNGAGGVVAATRGSDYIASGNIVKQTLVSTETTPTENYAINWVYG